MNTEKAANLAAAHAQRPQLLGLPYPWVLVVGAGLCMMMAYMVADLFGVFFKPISTEFGWSQGAFSVAHSVRMLLRQRCRQARSSLR